jgi:transketolase
MKTNPDVYFLNADMGINLVERFEEAYPERYANVGIAEQNLIGISAGLANLGYRPFAYTISNFLIHRCLEQIRNDICLHNYPVTLIGTSTGYDNAPLGPTHHILDDWGVLKSFPGIDIYCPSSVAYAASLLDSVLEARRPAYIRVPKGGSVEPNSDAHLVKLNGNSDNTLLVSYGNLAQSCLEVQRLDPRISVLVVNRLRPLDEQVLYEAMIPHKRIVVVEDHFPQSGLYGTLCEFFLRGRLNGRLESIGPHGYSFEVGSTADHFHKELGVDAASLLKFLE